MISPHSFIVFAWIFVGRILAQSVLSSETCTQVQTRYPQIEIALPGQREYKTTNEEYWSAACTALKPSCVILPRNAQQVSNVLAILDQNNERFAVKSGGHTPNVGYASIHGGPLIATKRMNHVDFDPASMTVRVGPGNHWHNVSYALQGTGVGVVGGRMGEVGVGGLLLGGGLSFLSGQYGWAANNIVEMDVVLSNSTIVKASAKENPDLWAALKGGGGNFGIVTSFTLRAYKQDKVWGGVRVYRSVRTAQMLEAIRDFTDNYPDPKAGLIATAELTVGSLVEIWVVFMFYDGPTPPPNVFAAFDRISHTLDLTKTRTMHDMLTFDNTFVIKNQIYTIATETTVVPNATVGPQIMKDFYDVWLDTAKSVSHIQGAVASIAFQPFPKLFAQRSRELGGMVADFDDSANRIIFELDYSYWYQKDALAMDEATVRTYTGLQEKVRQYTEWGMLKKAHLPLFQNDLYWRQDYWGRMRPENAARYREIRARYDGGNVLAGRTQGFHL